MAGEPLELLNVVRGSRWLEAVRPDLRDGDDAHARSFNYHHPMRIVHVVLQLRMGGQERFILNHSRELVARGHDVTVISMSEGGDLRRDFGSIPTRDVVHAPGGSRLSLYARLARALHELGPDV